MGDEMTQAVMLGLDVHGIQGYLFSTAKLREVIGASRIIEDFTGGAEDNVPRVVLRTILKLDECKTGVPTGDRWFISIRLGGGVVRLLLPNAALAHEFVKHASAWAIEHAAGLQFDAASVAFDPIQGDFDKSMVELIERIQHERMQARGGCAFNGFPFSAPCVQTSDAAAGYGSGTNERLCDASLDKRDYQVATDSKDIWASTLQGAAILQLPGIHDPKRPFVFDTEELAATDANGAYMAVVALDLNNLGEIGKQRASSQRGVAAARAFHDFTREVTAATRSAFREALDSMASHDRRSFVAVEDSIALHGRLPIRPLVFGGDDLTFVMHAGLAIDFTHSILTALDASGFKGAAGIALVKAKSPFSRAIDLAESLVASAKGAGRDQSRIDFMLCSGEIPTSVAEGRASRFRADSTLTQAPYTLGQFSALVKLAEQISVLPRSHIRGAVDHYRHGGIVEGHRALRDLCENLARGLGGTRVTPDDRDRLRALLEAKFIHAESEVGSPTSCYLDCVDLFRFINDSSKEHA